MPPAGSTNGAAVEFDFETRTDRGIALDEAPAACRAGRFCWLDLDIAADPAAAESTLRRLGANERAAAEAVSAELDDHYDLYEDCLLVGVRAAAADDGALTTQPVNLVLAERFLVTLHRGPVEFLSQVRQHYRQ